MSHSQTGSWSMRRLDLLQAQHVGLLALDELLHLRLPRADAVDVPGGDLHVARTPTLQQYYWAPSTRAHAERASRRSSSSRSCWSLRPGRSGRSRRRDHRHVAAAGVRLQHRRRLLPRHLHAARTVLEDARSRVRPDVARRHRRTEEGRTQWMAVISAPENIAGARSLPRASRGGWRWPRG